MTDASKMHGVRESAEKLWSAVIDELAAGGTRDGVGGANAFGFLRTPLTIAKQVNAGVPVGMFKRAVDRGLIRPEEIRLVLPERTYRDRKQKNENLTRDESDKFARMLQIIELATETFGSAGKAHRWLRQPKRRFDGHSPIQMLSTSMGAQAVEEMLVQIAHGIAA